MRKLFSSVLVLMLLSALPAWATEYDAYSVDDVRKAYVQSWDRYSGSDAHGSKAGAAVTELIRLIEAKYDERAVLEETGVSARQVQVISAQSLNSAGYVAIADARPDQVRRQKKGPAFSAVAERVNKSGSAARIRRIR